MKTAATADLPEIDWEPMFDLLSKEDDGYMQWLTENTNLASNCMDINDDQYTSAKDKISRLTEELLKEGIELDVINQPQ